MDPIQAIRVGIPHITGISTQSPARTEGAKGEDGSFGELVTKALETLNRIQQEADSAAASMAAGEPVDIHDVMIALQKADLSFQLALQVRNRVVEAYQEIMRMQV